MCQGEHSNKEMAIKKGKNTKKRKTNEQTKKWGA
jgi:hypothetical protein